METDDPPLVDGGWASKLVAATLQVGCCLLHTALSRCSGVGRPARYRWTSVEMQLGCARGSQAAALAAPLMAWHCDDTGRPLSGILVSVELLMNLPVGGVWLTCKQCCGRCLADVQTVLWTTCPVGR